MEWIDKRDPQISADPADTNSDRDNLLDRNGLVRNFKNKPTNSKGISRFKGEKPEGQEGGQGGRKGLKITKALQAVQCSTLRSPKQPNYDRDRLERN